MRLATLNISGPSEGRAHRLAGYLLDLELDALVLTETRDNAGIRLLGELLEAASYKLASPEGLAEPERGALIAYRESFRSVQLVGTAELAHRLPAVCLEAEGASFLLVGAYVPSRDTTIPKIKRKRRFLDHLYELVERYQEDAVILLGDLNVIGRDHVPRYPAFRCWELDALERIMQFGLVDAWERCHPGEQAYSWIGRTGNGYRYDYAFCSKALADAVANCECDHQPRTSRMSDHAALLITLDLAAQGALADD